MGKRAEVPSDADEGVNSLRRAGGQAGKGGDDTRRG